MFFGGLSRLDYSHPDDRAAVLVTWFGPLQPHITSTEGACVVAHAAFVLV